MRIWLDEEEWLLNRWVFCLIRCAKCETIAKPSWVAAFVELRVAVVDAKKKALFPGRVPHVRPSVHGPDTVFFECFYSICRNVISG